MTPPTSHTEDEITPADAVALYLDTRADDVSAATLQSHEYRLAHFIRWCDTETITQMDTLTPRQLHDFRVWRQADGDLNTVSLHTQLSTLRVFIDFCATIDIVADGLADAILIPTLSDDDQRRDNTLPPEQADAALSYLNKYEYASANHVLLLLLWRTGMRIGTLQSLDVGDYDSDAQQLTVRHRPGSDTTLKMGHRGERTLTLTEHVCTVCSDYLEHTRPDVTDDHDRAPLVVFGTTRPAKTTMREHVHRCTQPCLWLGHCPHDRTVESCDTIGYGVPTADCPSSTPPHDVRRGAITHWLSEDVPETVVQDRMNVNETVLDKHYDKRSEQQRAEQRRQYIIDDS